MNKKINKKVLYSCLGIAFISILGLFLGLSKQNSHTTKSNSLEATVLTSNQKELTLQDKNHIIYTFHTEDIKVDVGDNILIEYTGLLDKNTQIQDCSITKYTTTTVSKNEAGIPTDWLDNGIFKNYYILAYQKLKTLSLEEKIGQLFLVRYPDAAAIADLKKYHFAGYVFFERDFQNKTETRVKDMIKSLQNASTIPLLTAVDEEGGKVVRISSNPNLASSKFKSSREIYTTSGFEGIKEDTIEKSKLLKNLGLNLNLAPVVDVSTDPNDYMYERTLGENTSLTSTYAKTVIQASKNTGVSYTLKHFPGYGNNADTHTTGSTDNRTYTEILNQDLPPFKAGIDVGAEAVLVSHNTVTSIDPNNPASLSSSVHNLLRNNLDFTGIVITDDLAMGAVSSIDNIAVKAILAGNDLLITTDYATDIQAIKTALNNGTLDESLIDKLAFRVLAWKYYKGLMFEGQK